MDLSDSRHRERRDIQRSFLDGYMRERTLTEAELAAMDLSAPIRHLELLGLGVRNSPRRDGIGWLDEDFIDLHIGWMRRWRDERGSR